MKLTRRVFNSPLKQYTNFKDGSFVNLIKLNKPYSKGEQWAVYESTNYKFTSNGIYRTKEVTLKRFNNVVNLWGKIAGIKEEGIII